MSKFTISDVEFVKNDNGSMTISGDLKVKLTLDPSRPLRRFIDGDFNFEKDGNEFDGRAIDLVSVGHILYECMVRVGIAVIDWDDISMIRDIVANGHWNFERDGKPLYMSGYNVFDLIKCDSFQFVKQLLSSNVSNWALMQSAFLRSYYERDAVLLNALYLNSVRSQMDLNQLHCISVDKIKMLFV